MTPPASNFITLGQFSQKVFMLLGPLLLGADQHEVKNGNKTNQHDNAGDRAGSATISVGSRDKKVH
jgi:hypothetical protein